MTTDDTAALRQALMSELARIEGILERAELLAQTDTDPLVPIAAAEARQLRDRLRAELDYLGQVDRLDRFDPEHVIRMVMADPAVQAAADQYRAARNGPPPGLDHETWRQGQHDAVEAVVGVALRRAIDELGIPADQLPAALTAAARHWDALQDNTDD